MTMKWLNTTQLLNVDIVVNNNDKDKKAYLSMKTATLWRSNDGGHSSYTLLLSSQSSCLIMMMIN